MPSHLIDQPTSRAGRAWLRVRQMGVALGWLFIAAAVVFSIVTGFMGKGLFGFLENVVPGQSQEVEAESWPVETQDPAPGLVPGDGTFVDPAEVDRTDPDAVAQAAAMLMASHDAVFDATEYSADRARPLFAPEVPEVAQTQGNGVGGLWLEAQKYDAYSSPAATPLTIPALSHDHAHGDDHAAPEVLSADGEVVRPYEFRVHYHWQGRKKVDGKLWNSSRESPEVRTVQLSLAERDGQWVVVEQFYGRA